MTAWTMPNVRTPVSGDFSGDFAADRPASPGRLAQLLAQVDRSVAHGLLNGGLGYADGHPAVSSRRDLSFWAKGAVLAALPALAAFLVLSAVSAAALLQPLCVDTANSGSFRCQQPRMFLGLAVLMVAIEIVLLVVWLKKRRQ
jgi:hypothetical protein